MSSNELKAFAVGDMDIYVAYSAQEAVDLANDQHGDETMQFTLDDATELVDSDLDKQYPEFDENENLTGGTTTIRQWLSEAVTPGWLAGSDY